MRTERWRHIGENSSPIHGSAPTGRASAATGLTPSVERSRPQLEAALAACKRHKAKLVIAKLDRLSRNLAFVATLMERKVDFVCCAMPEANRLTIHIIAAMAEHERNMISDRTKRGLAAAKARGVRAS